MVQQLWKTWSSASKPIREVQEPQSETASSSAGPAAPSVTPSTTYPTVSNNSGGKNVRLVTFDGPLIEDVTGDDDFVDFTRFEPFDQHCRVVRFSHDFSSRAADSPFTGEYVAQDSE